MFLDKTAKYNPKLIETVFNFHQNLIVDPDTFVVDVDTFLENAKQNLEEAKKYKIELYFMLKQIGRNPYLARKLVEIGYPGAVVVDFREANLMMKHKIPIVNVGHLVQPNKRNLQKIVDYNCEYITCYSVEKIRDVNDCARTSGKIQKLLLRILDDNDIVYHGQAAGFSLNELERLVEEVKLLENVKISGVTSFPCYLYDVNTKSIQPTNNLKTIFKAKEILEAFGVEIENINAPSTTSITMIRQLAEAGATSGEPGHGLSGTTPMHASHDLVEKPCVVYLSEISHNFKDKSYAFGGGYYRRSHVSHALVGKSIKESRKLQVFPPSTESIDYHFGLSETASVNDTVVMAFRYQIFVTRSQVCLVEGIHKNSPKIVGLYTSLGDEVFE